MSDSINGLGKPMGPPLSRGSGTPETASPRTSSTPAGGDSVNLTDAARQLQNLVRVTSAEETVNADQVSAIRQALADGQYSIDSRQIAERLLQFDS